MNAHLFEILFTMQLFSTFFLTGLIWVIQLVHYPSFHYIEENIFSTFAQFHSKRITRIVLPMMFIELISAFIILLASDLGQLSFTLFIVNFVIIVLIWSCTFCLSMPCHKELMREINKPIINKLIRTNWPRTVLWSFKSLLLIFWTFHS